MFRLINHEVFWKHEARDRRRSEVYATLPEVTISSFTEIGQVEEEITVPLQRAYTGQKPVISASLADTPCANLGLWRLLDKLNSILGTSYTLDMYTFPSVLQHGININSNFGTIYSFLRTVWYTDDWKTIPEEIHKCKTKDQTGRQNIFNRDYIRMPNMNPRFVWDLYSNRVVPFWVTSMELVCPISHAWVDEKDRIDVWTPINGYQWPVPIPKDTDLKLIRIEMLNLGLEYVWLDVLCLRQRGGPREDLRAEEWKLDVPTIGHLYSRKEVVYCYLSGLGRPLSVEEGDLDSDRCWFNRAWTLQEIGRKRKICGDTLNGPLHAKPDKDGNYETEVLTKFRKKLESLDEIILEDHHLTEHDNLFRLLAEMKDRVSTNPVDKIAGLAFLLWPNMLPVYYESQSLENAWSALVDNVSQLRRGALFFLYPEPGDAGVVWRPSWHQVMTRPLQVDRYYPVFLDDDEWEFHDLLEAPCIEKGTVQGLAVVEEPGDHQRHGQLLVEDKDGSKHMFNIIANHWYPIPDGTYTLIGNNSYWVVGEQLPWDSFEEPLEEHGKECSHIEQSQNSFEKYVGEVMMDVQFKKLSVVSIATREEEEKLKRLSVAEYCHIWLV
ncbi:uncharacterized protein EV420DRAFT_1734330 [Desarmillaria tabescens]|uniref:Heterokaryon incompatibility domain-containing protein n=1 Tax=Armillaria tabescens TaxID=1929756 RepID=A0AA39NAX7_ARMTA|nr:uncharacterized protein EV420DRAFT_1734330 [Desarmillaria tabescens]KAK0462258.1 hypothetical protein EV420DRAFT_1734330 [Desarmillaria tabescens]